MKTTLGFDDARDILKKYGFPMPEGGLANTEDETVEIAKRIGFPVIIKSHSMEVSKAISINSPSEVRQKYQEIKNAAPDSDIIVQKHDSHGMEAIIGMTRDPHLGPIVTFGLSGVFAYLKDVSSRVAPVSREEAIRMIEETEAYDIVKGGGERKKSDIGSIADLIEKVSRLGMENDNIAEIEINPLFVYEKGATVIDARIRVE